jgi:hypothetical protein
MSYTPKHVSKRLKYPVNNLLNTKKKGNMNAFSAVYASGTEVRLSITSPTGGQTDTVTFVHDCFTEQLANDLVRAMRRRYQITKYGLDQDER